MSGISKRSLRTVALFEAGKGALVLLVGFGALSMLGRDLDQLAVRFVERSHLNPASHYPRVFLEAISKVTDAHLWVLAIGALIYSCIRGVETYGLWHDRNWASWLGIGSGSLYLPIECYEIWEEITGIRVTVFAINLLIVTLLALNLWRQRRRSALAR